MIETTAQSMTRRPRVGRNDWGTPQILFDLLDKEFHFTLDVCASAENTKCRNYLSIESDGLSQPWTNAICFMNPPHSNADGTRALPDWIAKAVEESKKPNTTVVALLPVDTSTKWFSLACSEASEIRFLVGRLRFIGAPSCAPFASAVLVFQYGRPKAGTVKFWPWRCQVRGINP